MRAMTVFILALTFGPAAALAENKSKTPKIVMPEAFADSIAQEKQWALAMTTIMPPSSDARRAKVSLNLLPERLADNEAARKKAAAYQKGLSQMLLYVHQPRAADAKGAATMMGTPAAKNAKIQIAAPKSEKAAASFRPGHAPVLEKLAPQLKSERAIAFRRPSARPILHLRKVH